MIETKKLSIHKLEQKATKTGKSYWVAETSEGKYSIWDIGLMELIRTKGIGNLCEVGLETKESNGKNYTNLVSLEKVLGQGQAPAQEKQKVEISESARLRRRTDCAIMAKDLVIAKLIPLDNLLDKAQALFNWVEETPDFQTADRLDKLEVIKI